MSLTDARQKASALGFGTRRRLLPFGSISLDEFDKKTLLWSFGGVSVTGRPTTTCVHQVTMQIIEIQETPIQTIETQETPIQTTIILDNIHIPC